MNQKSTLCKDGSEKVLQNTVSLINHNALILLYASLHYAYLEKHYFKHQ